MNVTDLHEALEQARQQVRGRPDAFERLARTRRRRQQMRRVEAGVVALAVATVGVWGVSRLFATTERVAVAGRRPAPPLPDRRIVFFGVRSVNPDGTGLTTLRPGKTPSWSPDGTQIVYARGRDGTGGLAIMDPDGSNVRPLTDGNDFLPDWSPDGRSIAFVRQRRGQSQVWVIGADGKNLRQLTSIIGGAEVPSWSPDSSEVMFSDTFGDIYTIGADGRALQKITEDRITGAYQPHWSPDGSLIAFASHSTAGWSIYTMRTDGSHVRRITDFDTGPGPNPAWSPDGSWIVFGAGRGDPDTSAIWIVDATGDHAQRVVALPHALGPAW